MLSILDRVRRIESRIESLMRYLKQGSISMIGEPDDFLKEWADMKVFISHFTKEVDNFTKEIDNSLTPDERELLDRLIKKAEYSLNLPPQ